MKLRRASMKLIKANILSTILIYEALQHGVLFLQHASSEFAEFPGSSHIFGKGYGVKGRQRWPGRTSRTHTHRKNRINQSAFHFCEKTGRR